MRWFISCLLAIVPLLGCGDSEEVQSSGTRVSTTEEWESGEMVHYALDVSCGEVAGEVSCEEFGEVISADLGVCEAWSGCEVLNGESVCVLSFNATCYYDNWECSSVTPCEGGTACVTMDCVAHTCVGSQVNCDDGNVCTTDSCDNGCVHDLVPGCCTSADDCDDNDLATVDACVNNQCVFTNPTPECTPNCEGKVCGADGCGGSCGNLCSVVCIAGQCQEDLCTLLSCDDGNPCTADSCDSATGCTNAPISGCGTCTPNCEGKVCGADGCGGSCGQCQEGTSCSSGVCEGVNPDVPSGSAFATIGAQFADLPLAELSLYGQFCNTAEPSVEFPHFQNCTSSVEWQVWETWDQPSVAVGTVLQIPLLQEDSPELPTVFIGQLEGVLENGDSYYFCDTPNGPSDPESESMVVYGGAPGGLAGQLLPVSFHPGSDGGCLIWVDLTNVYVYP